MANGTANLEQISRLLKMTPRHVARLAHDGILPKLSRGQYPVIPCVHAYIDYLRKMAEGDGSPALTDQRLRLTKLQADQIELKNRQSRGELIETDRAMKAWGLVCQAIRNRLLAIPTKAAPMLVGVRTIPEAKEMIENFIYEALGEIANPDLRREDRKGDKSGPVDDESTASVETKRVGRRKQGVESGGKRGARKVANGTG